MRKHSLNDAFELGKTSFMNGHFRCPYDEGTLKCKEWQRGFDTAYFENTGAPDVQGIQQPYALAV